jgi:hypothetical protein
MDWFAPMYGDDLSRIIYGAYCRHCPKVNRVKRKLIVPWSELSQQAKILQNQKNQWQPSLCWDGAGEKGYGNTGKEAAEAKTK